MNNGLTFTPAKLELGQGFPGLGGSGGAFEWEPADLFDPGLRVFEGDLGVIAAVPDPKSSQRTLAFIVHSLVT